MRSVLVRSLAVLAIGGAVLAGILWVASTVDARPPTVVAVRLTQPLAGDDRRAAVTTSIEVVFSEPVDARSAESAVTLEPDVDGVISWSGSVLTFTPSSPLALDTAYRFDIGPGIRDSAGNRMEDPPDPFEFSTVGRPSLAASDPVDGAVGVALDQVIVLEFTVLMDTASVEGALTLEPSFDHELRWNGRRLEIVPAGHLLPDLDYHVAVATDATDVSGVALSAPVEVRFRTVAPGLAVEWVVPANGVAGIAVTSPIAILFDRPLDPGSVTDDALLIDPAVAGSVRVQPAPGEPAASDGSGRLLVFTPAAPLAPNTTFRLRLAPTVASLAGGTLAADLGWSFTTGVPVAEISNQVTFISQRAGPPNVWAMNPDGSGQRQISSELAGVVDYAVSPLGDSLVVSDGRRLVQLAADGSNRRVMTDADFAEFDPAFSPDGRQVVFARVDPDSGAWLGLWVREAGGGDARPIAVPPDGGASPAATAGAGREPAPLRAPRYSPDGRALSFVSLDGWVGMLELETQHLTRVPFTATAAPAWLPGSSGVLLSGREDPAGDPVGPPSLPVVPMAPGDGDSVFVLQRTATSVDRTRFGIGSRVVAVAATGEIAYVTPDGSLWLTDTPTAVPERASLAGVRVHAAWFAPGGRLLVVEVTGADGRHLVSRLDPGSAELTRLAVDGRSPRWHP